MDSGTGSRTGFGTMCEQEGAQSRLSALLTDMLLRPARSGKHTALEVAYSSSSRSVHKVGSPMRVEVV